MAQFDHYPTADDCDYLFNEETRLLGPIPYECFWLKWKLAKHQNEHIRTVYLPILREAEMDLIREEPVDAVQKKTACLRLIQLRGIISLIDIPDDKINGVVMFDTIDFLSRALRRASNKGTELPLFLIEFEKALDELPSKQEW